MKKIIFSLVDFFNIDSFISSYFRKSAFLIKLIPNSSFYNKTKIKKIRVNGIKFILEPSDLAQHILFKPNTLNTETYGLQYLMKNAPNYVGEKKLIFDIGANCGQFSLLASASLKQVFPDINFTIHSFEPNPYVFERLSRNIRENIVIAEKIKCFNIGIGKEKGILQIQMPLRNSGAGSLLRNYQNEPHEMHLVDIISLDEHIKDEHLANYNVCFLKIDVEGFENNVLIGASNLIDTNSPDIYIEMGQGEDGQRFIINFLKQKNYTLFAEIKTKLIKITDANEDTFIRMTELYNIFATCSKDFYL